MRQLDLFITPDDAESNQTDLNTQSIRNEHAKDSDNKRDEYIDILQRPDCGYFVKHVKRPSVHRWAKFMLKNAIN